MRIDPNDYVACICEGNTEMAVIDMLLDEEALIFGRTQLLEGKPMSPRYFRSPALFRDHYLVMDYGSSKLHVFLIQDRKTNQYVIKEPYLSKIDGLRYVITAPEIEMLMIHSLNLYNEYHRQKDKPSDFLAKKIHLSTSKIKSDAYVRGFYAKHDLITAIKTHRSKSKCLSNGIFLADILCR